MIAYSQQDENLSAGAPGLNARTGRPVGGYSTLAGRRGGGILGPVAGTTVEAQEFAHPNCEHPNADDVMIARTIVWRVMLVAAIAACGDAGDAAQEAAPSSVLTTERVGQEADGAPRPGQRGVVRTTELRVGDVTVTAEIADTPALRERGLMGRESLPENFGMLFVYPDERELSFWMRNTPLALDIAFLDRSGTITNIETMQPNDDENTVSERPAMYALEMEAGWFEANAVEPGMRVSF